MPKATSGLTKTDFMRGMQCKRMLWLDQHHPKQKVIPPHIRQKLNQGNAFGDAAMSIFGLYTEVREYFPGTTCPNKKAMVRKTQELIELRTPVICEAAFMDEDGNYCAVDLLRLDGAGDGWELYEVKNSLAVEEQHIKDAAYQVYLIKDVIGLPITKASIIHNSGNEAEPFAIVDCTEQILEKTRWIAENIGSLQSAKYQTEEYCCPMGKQCKEPYECWYIGYCTEQAKSR